MAVEIPRLETPRLILRALDPGDFEAFAAMMADPDVARYLTLDGKPQDRADAWRSFAFIAGHWQMRGFGMWAVEEKTTGRFVGRIGPNYPEGWPDREIGWTIAREFWGKGYASEAARAAMDYAFDTLGWRRAISLIHPDNARSVAVAQRLGERRLPETFAYKHFTLLIYAKDRAGTPA